MSVSVIRATIDCDGCGKQFRVEMDPAWRSSENILTLWDHAEDAVRGGLVIDQPGSCSVQDDLMLCPVCTSEADALCDKCKKRPWTREVTKDRYLCNECN